jgi:hypothetical protein
MAAWLLRADPRIDENRVYIIGHSLGGMLAPRIHALGGDFAGLILMGATPRSLTDLFVEQSIASIVSGFEDGMISSATMDEMLVEMDDLADILDSIASMSDEDAAEMYIAALGVWAYYFKDLQKHPFTAYASDITEPILVLQGGSDFQILADVDFVMLQDFFAGRSNVAFKLYDGLNHLFIPTTATNFVQHANDMFLSSGVVDPQVIQDIADWILAR